MPLNPALRQTAPDDRLVLLGLQTSTKGRSWFLSSRFMSTLLNSLHLPSKSKPSSPSTSYASPEDSSAPAVDPVAVRALVFNGTIPLHVTIAEDELPPNTDLPVNSCYLEAHRISYLPLLLRQVRANLLDLILSHDSQVSDDSLWFSFNGSPLRWHWPIGLLYDYHTANALPSSASTSSRRDTNASFDSAHSRRTSRSRSSFGSTRRLPSTSASQLPWTITLHLKNPPTDALLLGSSVEACRSCFMNMVKETDFVRWGSVKRVTNLRKEQQDALWDSVITPDFERYWSVASKLVPVPSITASPSGTRSSTPIPGVPDLDISSMRSVPIRVYLPEGAPVLQEVVAPVQDGTPTTLGMHLLSLVPLFFPAHAPPLVVPIVHGIEVPLEAQLGWLGSCLLGADGWVNVVLRVVLDES